MTPANLRSFILEINAQHATRQYPQQANRLTKIQADGLYRELQLALRQKPEPLERTKLLRAWQDLRELGFDTELDPCE